MTPATYEQVRKDILTRKRKQKQIINSPENQSRLISEKINFTTKTDEDHKIFNHDLNTIRNPNNEISIVPQSINEKSKTIYNILNISRNPNNETPEKPDKPDNKYNYLHSDLYEKMNINIKPYNNPLNLDNKSTPIFDYLAINSNYHKKNYQKF